MPRARVVGTLTDPRRWERREKLNPFLIDPSGMAHHVVGERAPSVRKTPKEKAMIAKRFVLAASMVVLVAMSGHAYAGSVTILAR